MNALQVYPAQWYWLLAYSFAAGSVHTARVRVRNPSTQSLAYSAELYLGNYEGDKRATATQSFTLGAGQQEDIDFIVTMPAIAGTYHVYLDVYVGGERIAAYIATEDVTIQTAFAFSNASCSIYWAGKQYWLDLKCTIKNIGDTPGTRIIKFCYWPSSAGYPVECYYNYETFSLTLQPGESFYYSSRNRGVFAPIGFDEWGYAWLHDDMGGESDRCYISAPAR